MKEIITGFKTEKDVEETLKWIEENTDFCWWDGDKPTEWDGRRYWFEENQSERGLYIVYGNDFGYGCIGCLRKDEEYKEMNFKDLIGEEERIPKKGDVVLVRNRVSEKWEHRIFISSFPEKANFACTVVSGGQEGFYNVGLRYTVSHYKQMEQIGERKYFKHEVVQAFKEGVELGLSTKQKYSFDEWCKTV